MNKDQAQEEIVFIASKKECSFNIDIVGEGTVNETALSSAVEYEHGTVISLEAVADTGSLITGKKILQEIQIQ